MEHLITFKVKVTKRGKTSEFGPFCSLGSAESEAQKHVIGAKVVTIVRDSGGADHPANKGQYFLYRIIK